MSKQPKKKPEKQTTVEPPPLTVAVKQPVKKVGGIAPHDESDSSDDEPILNRVGDVPLEWYKDETHVGYDVTGVPITKHEKTALQRLLDDVDNKDKYRTIIDALHDDVVTLSNEDIKLILNIQNNRFPSLAYNPYTDLPAETAKFDMINNPFSTGPPSKKSFVPSHHERKVIAKLIEKIKRNGGVWKDRVDDTKTDVNTPYMLWDEPTQVSTALAKLQRRRIPPPRPPPPGSDESYNPPDEYLPTKQQFQDFCNTRDIDKAKRYLPQRYESLRTVPWYPYTMHDRFQRCLDLYSFPRVAKDKLNIDPDSLLPELPQPSELKPFPEKLAIRYKGHTAPVRSVSLSPSGQWLVTACDDHVVRFFEVQSGRLVKKYDLKSPVAWVGYSPSPTQCYAVAAVDTSLVFFVLPILCPDERIRAETVSALSKAAVDVIATPLVQKQEDADEVVFEPNIADLGRDLVVSFAPTSAGEASAGIVLRIDLHHKIKRFAIHSKGDYIGVLCPTDATKSRQVVLLQLSMQRALCPFRRGAKDKVVDCKFLLTKPHFVLATTTAIRVFDLAAQTLVKKFRSTVTCLTSVDVHPSGDHILTSSLDKYVLWYDMDFSDRPYKKLASHNTCVHSVAYHPMALAYPLFASAAASGQVHVYHGQVYDDYTKNAFLVPLRILKCGSGVMQCVFHPTLPWLVTSCEDGTVCCWVET